MSTKLMSQRIIIYENSKMSDTEMILQNSMPVEIDYDGEDEASAVADHLRYHICQLAMALAEPLHLKP